MSNLPNRLAQLSNKLRNISLSDAETLQGLSHQSAEAVDISTSSGPVNVAFDAEGSQVIITLYPYKAQTIEEMTNAESEALSTFAKANLKWERDSGGTGLLMSYVSSKQAEQLKKNLLQSGVGVIAPSRPV